MLQLKACAYLPSNCLCSPRTHCSQAEFHAPYLIRPVRISFSGLEITSAFAGLNCWLSSHPPRRPQRPSSSWDLKHVRNGPQPAAEPMGTPASRAVKSAVNSLSTSFAATFALSCTASEEPCMPIRRLQTPCPGLPGGRGITMEVPTKDLCHVRPSSEASIEANVTRRTCVPRAMAKDA